MRTIVVNNLGPLQLIKKCRKYPYLPAEGVLLYAGSYDGEGTCTVFGTRKAALGAARRSIQYSSAHPSCKWDNKFRFFEVVSGSKEHRNGGNRRPHKNDRC